VTDTDLIKEQAKKILMLENLTAELQSNNHELSLEFANAEMRETNFARKLKAIEDEINNYQFDSATNLQNKIKTILMSSDEEVAKHQD
jgi:hypothetical protein